MAEFEELRQKQRKLADELLSQTLPHVDWPAERLAEFREEALRDLIRLCKARSKWHQERLAEIDTESFTEVDLRRVPPMTKADLRDNFDEIVTHPALTLDRCEAHIESGETYLDNEFCVFSSGGASGVRAVSIWGWEETARNFVVASRLLTRWAHRTGIFRETGLPTQASVGGGFGGHGSHHLSVIFGGGGKNTFSVADPLDSIVGGLNRIQPGVLHVYASLIPRLILEAEAGRLKIEPACLLAGAEPLLEEHEELAVQTWGCPIFSNWGATEVGLLGSSSGFDPGLLLYDDHVIIEPVDIDGNPVEPGVRADKLLVTPLFHDVLPVLRYELTDQLTFLDESASCGSSFTRTSLVEARLHDSFTYEEGVHVHWHTFRAVFEQCRNVHEYQVHQTPAGALVKIVERGELDTPSVHGQLRESLQRLGLENPEIEIEIVPAIERTGSTLKIKRFVPLADPD